MHLNPPFICCALLVFLIACCRHEVHIQLPDGDFDQRDFLGGTMGWLNSFLCTSAVLVLRSLLVELKKETFYEIRIAKNIFSQFHRGKVDSMVLDTPLKVMTYDDFYRVSFIGQPFMQDLWLLATSNCEVFIPKTNKRKYMREKLNT